MQLWGPAFLLKKTPFHFTCCEEHLWTTASKLYSRRGSNADVFLCILWIIQEHPFVEDLRTTGSEIPVGGSLFNKVVYLTTWWPLTVLETESSKGISQWILWNFLFFCRTSPSNIFSHDVFSFLLRDHWSLQPKVNLFGGEMENSEKEFTSPLNLV